MTTIPAGNLGLVAVPALLVVFILWYWAAEAGTALYALARMVLQLCTIGFVLTYIFETDHFALVLVVFAVMVLTSSWIALRTVPERRAAYYGKALLSTAIVNGALLTLITQFVLDTEPWYNPRIVVPIAGMTFAVGMNALSLFSERYLAEKETRGEIESRNVAYRATLIPTINSLFAVGLVSLPGMMTGQILSGVPPLTAVRYQIMIMLMLFSSSGLTAACFYYLIRDASSQPPDPQRQHPPPQDTLQPERDQTEHRVTASE